MHPSQQEILATAKEQLSQMIDLYHHLEGLLEEQMNAVATHDFDAMNQCSERQITMNGTLHEVEMAFQKTISNLYEAHKIQEKPISLSRFIEHVPQAAEVVAGLRERLIHLVGQTQRKQTQLVNLLHFAQDHINATLKDMYSLSNQHGTVYSAEGAKMADKSGARIINRTA